MGIVTLVVRPAGQRTLAGFTLGELLSRQAYGELYRASGDGRRDARLLIVLPALAADPRFNDALGRGTAPLLGAFHHRAVVGTVVVARDGKDLVIVTEAVEQARSLDEILARGKGRGLPPRIAATIARSVIDALATAHALGITHGALHPRSVLVDGEGVVRVTDFAVGYAAMAAAAGGSEAVELRGLGGYLAPELVLGDEPSPAADVYAIGALLFALLSGTTPPGTVNATPALERLVQRALDTDLHRRFTNAIEVQENFAEALEDDRWETVAPAEVAAALAELARPGTAPPGSDGNLDDATEDLLASLAGAVEPSRGGVLPAPEPIAARSKRASGGLDSLLDDLEEPEPDDDNALTTVEDDHRQAGRDPISEIIALAPAPVSTVEEPRLRRAPALAAPDPTGQTIVPAPTVPPPPVPDAVPDAVPVPLPDAVPVPVPVSVPVPAATVEAAPVRRKLATPLVDEPGPVEPPSLGRSKTWLWATIVVAVAAALAVGIKLQGNTLSSKQKAAAAERQRRADEAEQLTKQLEGLKDRPGTIRLTADSDYGTVWLLLGRAPFDSIAITTANVWQVRVELEGYQPVDVDVIGSQWTGDKAVAQATISVPLTPSASASAKPLPKLPPDPVGKLGLLDGRGRLKVETTPPGAAVWLFVGQTNHMELSGLTAGRDYEFKVVTDGFMPAYLRVAAEDWRAGGDPNLPLSAAPLKPSIDQRVELVPDPKKPGKPR